MIREQNGFSLLEALAAIALLATSGMALFSWFSVVYDGLIRLEEVQEKHALMDDLYEYFSTLNVPGETMQEMQINGFEVSWQSRLTEPAQTGRSYSGGLSNFELGLYDVEIIVRKDDLLVGSYEARLTGYKKVRDVTNEY